MPNASFVARLLRPPPPSAALCIFLPSGTQAQDILRELEATEPEQGQRATPTITPTRRTTKKKDAPKSDIKVTLATSKPRRENMRSKQHQRTKWTTVRSGAT